MSPQWAQICWVKDKFLTQLLTVCNVSVSRLLDEYFERFSFHERKLLLGNLSLRHSDIFSRKFISG
jgi:hypothetical protein